MKGFVAVLIVLLNFMLIAQPALGQDIYSNKILFQEQFGDASTETYFNPDNATTLAQRLNLTDGVYKGPQYPFAAIRLDIRDVTKVTLEFTVNISYEDIMNGVWDWKILVPFTGDFSITSFSIEISDGPVIDIHNILSFTQTKYGTIIETYEPIRPGMHTFTVSLFTRVPITFYICRENQEATLILEQYGKQIYKVHAAYAFLFKRGFGQKGMGAMEINSIRFDFYEWFFQPNESLKYYTTLGLPLYVSDNTDINITMIYVTATDADIHYEKYYVNRTFSTKGFYYLFQSSPIPKNDTYTIYFDLNFSQPAKLLFCADAPTGSKTENNVGTHTFVKYEPYGKNVDLNDMGIVFWHHIGPEQYAMVTKQGDMAIYDFGFASVEKYSSGDYVIHPHGNYKEWVIVKNVTVKSIGAVVDELQFSGRFSFSSQNDLLPIILAGVTKVYDLLKQTWEFLQHIGEIIWQYLLKFWKFVVDLASWIWDSLGGIFNYLLYIFIPTAIMLTIAFLARIARGLQTQEVRG